VGGETPVEGAGGGVVGHGERDGGSERSVTG
jgi:hypothetical protein